MHPFMTRSEEGICSELSSAQIFGTMFRFEMSLAIYTGLGLGS